MDHYAPAGHYLCCMALVSLLALAPAEAAVSTTTLAVKMTIAATCSISTSATKLGTGTSRIPAVHVTCSNNTPHRVGVETGAGANGETTIVTVTY